MEAATGATLGFMLVCLYAVGRYHDRKFFLGNAARKLAIEIWLLFSIGLILAIFFLGLPDGRA